MALTSEAVISERRSPEALVIERLNDVLGGRRGVAEAAIPTAMFTVVFVVSHALWWAVGLSLLAVVPVVIMRVIERSTPKYALNAIVGIAVGAGFAWSAGASGGSVKDQALAYFLPGILYNLGYAAALVASVLVRWPFMGLFIGAVAGDLTGWRVDRAMVRLCGRLTLLLAAPCLVRVAALGSLYLAGRWSWMGTDTAVAALGATKLALGWPVQLAVFAAMGWLLTKSPTATGEPGPEGLAEAAPGQD